ncbi:MAG TPA: hypothetical protein VLI06_00715 [Solimonas sp.]|nr:hypothetical protein [Solimonas sp.]
MKQQACLFLLLSLPLSAMAFPPPPFDFDEDGRISRDEWLEAGAMRFRAADRNLDGQLDAQEQRLLRPRMFQLRLVGASPPRMRDCLGGESPPGPLAEGLPPPELPEDEDGNGMIGRAEMEAAGGQAFATLDRDGDGVLGEGELPLPPLPRPGRW